ncbi:MAG: PadR family transcriptional regulator [Gemmatimonadota bacterium]|nr:PadR family transcriptional regulator [Gemmatimonadota bacterium]
MADNVQVLKGTLDLLILKSLRWGPAHGYAVVTWLKRTTDGAFQIDDGALYPALHRLQNRELIEAEWGRSENNRRAKFYRLTPRGRHQLEREISTWSRFSEAIWKVIDATEAPA